MTYLQAAAEESAWNADQYNQGVEYDQGYYDQNGSYYDANYYDQYGYDSATYDPSHTFTQGITFNPD